jgi:peroxiredoxin Q/BCP
LRIVMTTDLVGYSPSIRRECTEPTTDRQPRHERIPVAEHHAHRGVTNRSPGGAPRHDDPGDQRGGRSPSDRVPTDAIPTRTGTSSLAPARDDPFVLSPGQNAPSFDLPDHLGGRVRLDELRGSWVLLWWYPKAATPG